MALFGTEMLGQMSGAPALLVRDEFAFRKLGPADEIAVRQFLLGLDDASRIARFACVLSDDGIVRHARRALCEAVLVAGLFVGGELCGLVELYESREVDAVEAAFAVTRSWRRRGVGTALLFAALDWARHAHHASLHMVFSRGNWPMRRLASKAGPSFDLTLDELTASVVVGDGRIDVAAAAAKPICNDVKLCQSTVEIAHAKAF